MGLCNQFRPADQPASQPSCVGEKKCVFDMKNEALTF